MTETLFNPSLLWPAGLAVVAVIVVLGGLRSGVRPVWATGLALLVLGGGWLAAAVLVETSTERAVRRTGEIVDAAGGQQIDRFAALLDPPTALPGFYDDREAFVDGARETLATVGMNSAAVVSSSVDTTEPGAILVDADVFSRQAVTQDRPQRSAWRFRYVETDGGLVLQRIEMLELGDQTVSQIKARLR